MIVNGSEGGSLKKSEVPIDGVIPMGGEATSAKSNKKKAIHDVFVNNASSNNEFDTAAIRQEKLRAYNISYAIHMLIPAYGIAVVVFVLINKFQGS